MGQGVRGATERAVCESVMVFRKIASVKMFVPDKSVHKVAFRSGVIGESGDGRREDGGHGSPDGGPGGSGLGAILVPLGKIFGEVLPLHGDM